MVNSKHYSIIELIIYVTLTLLIIALMGAAAFRAFRKRDRHGASALLVIAGAIMFGSDVVQHEPRAMAISGTLFGLTIAYAIYAWWRPEKAKTPPRTGGAEGDKLKIIEEKCECPTHRAARTGGTEGGHS